MSQFDIKKDKVAVLVQEDLEKQKLKEKYILKMLSRKVER